MKHEIKAEHDRSEEADSENGAPTAPKQKKSRLVKTALVLLRLTLVLLLSCVALRLLLPTLVERGTAYASRHYLGLPARLENVDFFLWEGRLVLEDVSLAALPDAVTPLKAAWEPPPIPPENAVLHLRKIAVGWSWRELLDRKVRLMELAVESPSARVLRESDGRIDPLRHARPLAKPSAAEKPEAKEPSKPWKIEVQRFVLSGPDVSIVDAPTGEKLLEFSLELFELGDTTAVGADVGFGVMAIRGPELRLKRELVMAETGTAKQPPAKSKGAQPAAPASTPAAAPGLRIRAVDMERAKFTWVSKEGPLDVLLTLKASDITADQGKRFPLELALQTGDGKIGLTGNVGILPPYYEGKVKWEGLSFPPLLLAAHPELAAWLKSADASGELDITADVAGVKGPPSLSFSGRASVDSFAAVDPSNSDMSIAWQRLEVVMKDMFVPLPEGDKPLRATKAHFEHISLVDPRIMFIYPARSPVSGGGGQAAEPSKPATTPPPAGNQTALVDLVVGRFDLTGGNIAMRDTKVGVTSKVRDLSTSISDLRYPGPTFGSMTMRAGLPESASLSIDGSLAAGQTGDFAIALQGLDLPAFSPYSQGAGVTLDSGNVSLQTKVKMHGKAIQTDSEVVLNRLGISLRSPDSFSKEFGVPIDLALALLSDPAGDIRLTVPVSMDEKGVSVSTGDVIGSALKAALVGAISSPLKLLGAGQGDKAAPGGAPFSIEPVQCVPGGADPVRNSQRRIDGFLKLLASRPNMALVLRGRVDAEDRPLIAARILLERARSGQGLPELPETGILERHRIKQYLTKLGKGEAATLEGKDRDLYQRYVAAIEIPKSSLEALAKQRAEKVRQMLVAKGANPKSLGIGEQAPDGKAGVLIEFRRRM